MKILLCKVLIADETSPFHNSVQDIFIEDGLIKNIGIDLQETVDTKIEVENAIASQGWIDIFSHFCEPGFEFKETIETGLQAAAAGGYTHVFALPNTNPTIASKAQVEFVANKSANNIVNIFPIGAVTKNIEGKELSEMYDMHNSGAIAFSDGLQPVQTSGLLLKALQYIKAFDGTIIQMPIDKSIGTNGLVNEGIVSTQLGLAGIPSIAEEIIIKLDIDLLRYTQSKLHITGVSTAAAIELIDTAKKEGLQITCSVTPYHLFFCDEDLTSYDTNLKTNPPLRSRADMVGLRKAVVEGKVDCIATHHLPQDIDNKICEFEAAKNGMIGLQTTFHIINEILPTLSNTALANLLSSHARKIFNLKNESITIGSNADITLFSRDGTTLLNKQKIKSLSYNTPFLDKTLQGKIIAIINKGMYQAIN